jgi:hypothetical protein
MKIQLKHSNSNLAKDAYLGFSWGTFFIGPFEALRRGDGKWFVIQLISNLVTVGFAWLFFMFVYNKIHIKDLLSKGFVPADESVKHTLIQKGYIIG